MTRLADPSLHPHVDCGDPPLAPVHGTTEPVNPAPSARDPSLSGPESPQAFIASSETVISSSRTPISDETADTPYLRDPSPGLPKLRRATTALWRRSSATKGVPGSHRIRFLSLLWFGYGDKPEAANAPWIWRRIAVNDWMTRAITISALVLRSVVSLQVALCTSMTAALVLEKRSARKSDVAYLSIARSVSDGPRKVAQLLFTSRSWSVLAYVELWLISLLAVVMLALQFSSTLLLSDIQDFVIVGEAELKSVVNFGTFDILNTSGGVQAPLLQNDPIYAVFGEERSSADITPSTPGFSDTGIIRRGFLPFQGTMNRTTVRRYQGSTLVTNSHIVCVPPQIQGHLLPRDDVLEYTGVGHMVGTLNYSQSIRQVREGLGPLCSSPKCESVDFDCSIPGSMDDTSAQSNFCFIETVGLTTRAIAEVWYDQVIDHLNTEAEPWSLNSTMYLVVRSNMTAAGWDAMVDSRPLPLASRSGEWNKFEISSGRTVDVSLCFSRFYIQPRYVDMIAKEPTQEPVVTWNGINVNYDSEHDTRAAATFLGLEAPLKPPRERGLMDYHLVNILPIPDPNISNLTLAKGWTYPELSAEVIRTILLAVTTNAFIPGSMSGCLFCMDYSFANSQQFDILFTDIVETTGRAAAAIHTYLAICATTIYDTYLSGFNVTENVQLATTASVRTPGPCSTHECAGFISVTTLLGLHSVLVAVITTLFVTQARYSSCSNTWHAVAQLMASEELAGVLEHSNRAKDDVVAQHLRIIEGDDFVRLGQTSGSTRVQVLRMPSKEEKTGGDS
ncbi:hypothetical protein NPX13_g6324 [Xylaria arbuscula]|uniref:Uncharacterized protein n=1 Tax=Xylaria arbuscula TaxID=114810 RepID=A0A9W8NCG1_9PEZI|nr:hypothetical protein NPX13_g6324 [Xylaria arbuscula]